MNTLNPSNRLFLAIVMSLAACSVSHKPEGASDLGTPSKPIDDTVRLNVSEDRVLVTDLVKKGGTLANVSTDELGTDAKALSLTDVGNGLTARLNKALVPGADIKEINATLDKYLTDILEQDIEVASKKETEATELVKKKVIG